MKKIANFLIVAMLFLACSSNNFKRKIVFSGDWYEGKLLKDSITEPCTKVALKIYNNPFNLDSTFGINVTLNNEIVYSGAYNNILYLNIPIHWLQTGSTNLRPGITLEKNGFISSCEKKDASFSIHSTTENFFLVLVFSPERRATEDRFLIFQPFY